MRLYHGSNCQIEAIDLNRGKTAKDFGKGFYLSPSLENAKDWADSGRFRRHSAVSI